MDVLDKVKNQSFFILKFASDRLRNARYNIDIDLYNARRNNELIRIGDSALLREIRRIKNIEFSTEILRENEKNKRNLSKKANNSENRRQIVELENKIDAVLYVPELISIAFSDVRHYRKIIDNGGFTVNGKKYIRLLCGAGHARRSTVLFCMEEYFDRLVEFMECGRDPDYKVNPNKFNSYFALATSATNPVSRCNFVVVPDLEVDKQVSVDCFIATAEEDTDPTFEARTVAQKCNIFDGQGLISKGHAQVWAGDLGLDWIPSAFIFRGAWSKGLLVTFDFHELAQREGVKKIKDIYGVEHWIDDIDIILSMSQFKMAGGYESMEAYSSACKKYNFGWGVSRYSPKADKTIATTTYQYLQAMHIEDNQIPEICESTIAWLKDISGMDWVQAILFLIGENYLGEVKSDWLNKFQEPLIKALILEPQLINDTHVKKHLLRLINKKIRESYMGVLNVRGNYQFIVNDPYAQAEHSLGLPVKGLLQKGCHYSNYWNKLGVSEVSCFRSPMTWRSEQLVLNLQDNYDLQYWYGDSQYSNIIFNIYGDDLMRLSGADVDGDIVMTTPSFVDCHYKNYSIPTYERKDAIKQVISHDQLWFADTLSFGSKIGLITNYGTTFFSMLSLFEEDSKEYGLLINRLKVCNVMQNMQIDKTKGIIVYDVPTWWDKWNKNGDSEKVDLYNSILCRQRPYFMRYVYPQSYGKNYKKHLEVYDSLSQMRHKMSFKDLMNKENKNESELKLIDDFYHYSPVIETKSTMNNICRHMESQVQELKHNVRDRTRFNYRVLMGFDVEHDDRLIQKMVGVYQQYSAYRRNKHDGTYDTTTPEQFFRELKKDAYQKISSNGRELANLAVEVCYNIFPKTSKDFVWKLFGKEVVDNIMENTMGFFEIPVLNEGGNIEYLGKKYSLERIDLNAPINENIEY